MVRSSPLCVVALAGMGASFQTDMAPIRFLGHHKSQPGNSHIRWRGRNLPRRSIATPYAKQSLMSSTVAVQTGNEENTIQNKFFPVSPDEVDTETVNGEQSMEINFQQVNGVQETVAGTSEKLTLKEKTMAAAVLVASIASFVSLILFSGAGSWRYFTAGGICAAFSHSLTTPIDVIKTRQQVDPELAGKGVIKSTMKIIKKNGIGTLLAGLGPTTVGYLIEGAVKFGVYEILKPVIGTMLGQLATFLSMPFINSKFISFLLSGFAAGTVASVSLCPMESLRIKMVAEPEYAQAGLVQGSIKMAKTNGISGFWKGFTPMLCKQVPYTVTKNVSFDFFTTMCYSALRVWGVNICSRYKLLIPLLSAMMASVLSTISSQPGDMLLSLVSSQEGVKRTREFTKEILKENGIKGFFVGIKARFVHVGVIVTLQLLMYDYIKRLCGIAATGL